MKTDVKTLTHTQQHNTKTRFTLTAITQNPDTFRKQVRESLVSSTKSSLIDDNTSLSSDSDDDNGRDRVFSDASYDDMNVTGGSTGGPPLPKLPSSSPSTTLPRLLSQPLGSKNKVSSPKLSATKKTKKVKMDTPKKSVKTPEPKRTPGTPGTPQEERESNARRGSLWDDSNVTLSRMLSRNEDDEGSDDDDSGGDSDWDWTQWLKRNDK